MRFTYACRRPCVPSSSSPARLLADLARALDRLSVRWYVFGAQAALIWGRPRMTTDVDVTVCLGRMGVGHLLAELQKAAFHPRVAATPTFIEQTRVLPVLHTPTGLPVDVVMAGPGLEEAFASRAVIVEIGGTPVPVISPADLLVTKVLAGRAKDIEDIQGVLAERGDRALVDQVRAVLAMLEQALGQSDLIPLFEREWDRANRSTRR